MSSVIFLLIISVNILTDKNIGNILIIKQGTR